MLETAPPFRSGFGASIFNHKYRHEGCETWELLAHTLAWEVCGGILDDDETRAIEKMIARMEFIPGGRYLYYAGRPNKYYNNCYLLRVEEDTREEWASHSQRAQACLMTGGGIGSDYSIVRPSGAPIRRTGGVASGPLSLMEITNEIGRRVMQGGSRRSAIYASLSWNHANAPELLRAKDWDNQPSPVTGYSMGDLKRLDFNFPCALDHTNISFNYDDKWLDAEDRLSGVFRSNIEMAMKNGEPGFSFNFGDRQNETLRNACTEVTSEDDSDVCNLGSLNLSRIDSLTHFGACVRLATLFLLCGTLRAVLPYDKVYRVRERNRRLGLGLMGVHEWLLQRGHGYEVVPDLHRWLAVYRDVSDEAARAGAERLGVSSPVANRAIAPTGSIGILAGTTTGIEPLFAVAYKRRYLKNNKHVAQHVVEPIARHLVNTTGIDPDSIETALSLAAEPEKRIRFQADVQDYVDMAISSTLNLPAWGSEHNNPDKVTSLVEIVSRYAPRLRGLTFYPDGARGGQPLTPVAYNKALKFEGEVVEESADVCSLSGKGGTCGE